MVQTKRTSTWEYKVLNGVVLNRRYLPIGGKWDACKARAPSFDPFEYPTISPFPVLHSQLSSHIKRWAVKLLPLTTESELTERNMTRE